MLIGLASARTNARDSWSLSIVFDIGPGLNGSIAVRFARTGEGRCCSTVDSRRGREIWVTDGGLYFKGKDTACSHDGSIQTVLIDGDVSDGPVAGTGRIGGLVPAAVGEDITHVTVFEDRADMWVGVGPWVPEPTARGTRPADGSVPEEADGANVNDAGFWYPYDSGSMDHA
ncbi:MAG: hypothetical protein ACJAR2_001087 [Ilumatobacter sp.]|jgi:hypothetical protein